MRSVAIAFGDVVELLLVDAREAGVEVDLARHVERLAGFRRVELRERLPRAGDLGEALDVTQRELVTRVVTEGTRVRVECRVRVADHLLVQLRDAMEQLDAGERHPRCA